MPGTSLRGAWASRRPSCIGWTGRAGQGVRRTRQRQRLPPHSLPTCTVQPGASTALCPTGPRTGPAPCRGVVWGSRALPAAGGPQRDWLLCAVVTRMAGPTLHTAPSAREAGVLMSPTWRAELWLLGLLAALAGEVRFPCSLVIPLPRSPQGQHIHEIPVGPLQRLGTAQPLGRPALRRAPFPPSGGSYQGPLAGGTVRGTPAPLLSPAVVLSSCWRSRALPHFQQVGARGALPQPEGGRSDRGCAWVGAGGGDPTLAGVPGS